MYSTQNSEDEMKKNDTTESFLKVENLVTNFYTSRGIVKALDSVSFSISKGEIFGLVGESGCGKSVTALSVMDLVTDPPGRVVSGKVIIDGFNIFSDVKNMAKIIVKSENDVKIKRNKRAIKRHNMMLSKIRGKKIGMVFQEPSLALNPVLRAGDQIIENIMLHNRVAMAQSLINRANLSVNNVDDLINDVKSNMNDIGTILNSWCKKNALADVEDQLLSIFRNYDDRNEIENEIVTLIKEGLESVDTGLLIEARNYYEYTEKLQSLNLELYDTSKKVDEETVRNVEERIKELQKTEGSKFMAYRFKKIFTGKRVENIFRLEARRRAKEILTLVNLSDPERIMRSYPHELSGGMQQRVMIAIALASDPKMLIADEATTALDVTTQAQILKLIKNLNQYVGASILFITHDLAVIAEMCNRVAVMYAGNIVEEGLVIDIFEKPKHPYTVGLLGAIPSPQVKTGDGVKLQTIPGSVPNLITPPSGCRFHPRCNFAMPICSESKPKLIDLDSHRKVACFLYSTEVDA